MSSVTSIMLYGQIEAKTIDIVNKWIYENYNENVSLKPLDIFAGGNKIMEFDIYGGAFNRFPNEIFITFLKTVNWNNK